MNKAINASLLVLTAFFCSLASASDDKLGVTADFPALSPVTNEVVFSSDLDGPTRLWAIGMDGKSLRKISKTWPTQTNVFEVEPAWSPDGRHIAYVSIADGNADIWVVQADGAYATQLTHNGANNTRPAWSPDGSKIVFVSDKDGTKDIWLMNSDGSGATKIVGLPGEENRPSFSPSGDRIVFSESNDGAATLMIAGVNGSNRQTITTGSFHDWDPHWGANGIVFSSDRDQSGHWKIWTVQPDGTGLHAVGNFQGLEPVWAKDGRIFFTEELAQSRALVSISILNPQNNAKQLLVDIQGYPVPIDIRPGSSQNNVNPKSQGKIDVAILSTKDFDAVNNVVEASITFGHSGGEASLDSCNKAAQDVNGDGLPDLLCRFVTARTGFIQGDTKGVLRFLAKDGRPFTGGDVIRTVPDDN